MLWIPAGIRWEKRLDIALLVMQHFRSISVELIEQRFQALEPVGSEGR